MSPSAISQRIKAMEQIAGKVLLRRSNPSPPPMPDKASFASPARVNSCGKKWNANSWVPAASKACLWRSMPIHLPPGSSTPSGTLSREDSIFCDLRREGEFHSSAMLRSGEVMAVITSKPEKIPGCSVETLGVARYWCVATPDYVQRYLPGWPKTMSHEELNRAPVVEYDRKDFVQDVARALIEKRGRPRG